MMGRLITTGILGAAGLALAAGAASAQTPCGTWEVVDTPSPGTVNNFFVDAEEAGGTVYALLLSTDSPVVRPPWDFHVLRRDGDRWTDLGGPENDPSMLGLELNALGVAPDGTIWVGGLFFPRTVGRNPAPVVASRSPGGQWSALEEVTIPDTAVEPTQRRPAQIRSIEVAPDGTVFASGGAGGFGGGALGIDSSVPLFLVNDGSGFVETFVAPGQDWPGGSGRGAGTFLNDAIAFAADDVWLAGRHSDNGTIAGGLLLHWDGETLGVEEDPDTPEGGLFLGRDLGGIDGERPESLMVAGQTLADTLGPPFGTLGHYDGSDWSLAPTPWLGSVFDPVQSFDAIVTARDGTAWATGVFAETTTPFFDGSSWSLAPFIPEPPAGQLVRITELVESGDGSLWGFGSLSPMGTSYAVRLACDTPCRPDLDGDGELTLFDFLAFQNAFDAGEPRADFDGDGELTLFDFLAFQNAFDAGCP